MMLVGILNGIKQYGRYRTWSATWRIGAAVVVLHVLLLCFGGASAFDGEEVSGVLGPLRGLTAVLPPRTEEPLIDLGWWHGFLSDMYSMFPYPKPRSRRYYLSACIIVYNEREVLREMILRNMLVGVEHFFLLVHQKKTGRVDNEQTWTAMLGPLIKLGMITIKPIDEDYYTHERDLCVALFGEKTTWMTFLDADECIARQTEQFDLLIATLRRAETKKNVGALYLTTNLFLSNGRVRGHPKKVDSFSS